MYSITGGSHLSTRHITESQYGFQVFVLFKLNVMISIIAI